MVTCPMYSEKFTRCTLLTNCFAEYEQQTFYGALVVTLAMLLRLVNCSFIIIIIIIINVIALYMSSS